MTLFVDVPDDVVRQQDADNLYDQLVTPNKVHVLINKNDITVGKQPEDNPIQLFDEITIQGGRRVYINLESPITSAAFTNVTNYVNLVVQVDGQGWRDIGNINLRVPLSIYRLHTWHRFTTSMLLDFIGQSLVTSTADYRLRFGAVFKTSASSTGTRVNGLCDINATGKGGRGKRLDSVADQNYMRLIVEEVG